MPPPFSRGDRVKCLATMWDLSDSDDEGGSSANNKPQTSNTLILIDILLSEIMKHDLLDKYYNLIHVTCLRLTLGMRWRLQHVDKDVLCVLLEHGPLQTKHRDARQRGASEQVSYIIKALFLITL